MNHEDASSRLNDYVDDQLTADAHGEVEAHLEGCDLCRDEVRFLRSLLADAAALPRSVSPDRDLWSGISDRMDGNGGASVDFEEIRRRSTWPRWSLLAAAAVLLMAASSAITAFIVRDWYGVSLAEAP
ncbi:MAG: zf-HC2 domain-containing protein, partial [Candidatus Latescibacteria bacterium]|nr:zf-HC2 domain-containing protein [Candidatus Latescibacterota bacterium]